VEKPIPGSYAYLKNILTQHTENQLAKRDAEKQFQDDVKSIIIDLLPKGIVSIERISRELAVSRWTLARKLKREKTTFKALLTAVRKELAMRYLKTTQWSTNEIALLLGYSEASAFQRAFKTWTGKNPKVFRIFSKNRLVDE
jgi:AraC-like DNA-binding protein